MTGIADRSGGLMGNVPCSATLPPQSPPDSVFTISFPSMPSARERDFLEAVTFITAGIPPVLWKTRSLFVRDAISGAWNLISTGSSISVTSPFSRIVLINSRIVSTPAVFNMVADRKVVKHPCDNHVHKIIDGPGVVIKARARNHDCRSCLVCSKHIFQMNPGKGHFPWHKNAGPS